MPELKILEQNQSLIHVRTRGCHFCQKVDLGGKNTFYSQSVLHHFLSISQFLDFSNLILNSYFEVTFVTCQDGWVVRALDCHARDPWFKSHWQQAFLLRKGFQKFFKKWLSPMWKWWDISSSSIMAISSLVFTFSDKFSNAYVSKVILVVSNNTYRDTVFKSASKGDINMNFLQTASVS